MIYSIYLSLLYVFQLGHLRQIDRSVNLTYSSVLSFDCPADFKDTHTWNPKCEVLCPFRFVTVRDSLFFSNCYGVKSVCGVCVPLETANPINPSLLIRF